MPQGRGMLTDRVKKLSVELFGRELTVEELRLMPYIQYVSVNEQIIDFIRLNTMEKRIVNDWLHSGELIYCEYSHKTKASPDFWEKMSKIIHAAYVDLG